MPREIRVWVSATELPHFRRLVEFIDEVQQHADDECDGALQEIVLKEQPATPPARLLLCLHPHCYGDFYYPLADREMPGCPNDGTHPVQVYRMEWRPPEAYRAAFRDQRGGA